MNLVCNIVFFSTAIITIVYDYKTQRIPVYIILLNYVSLCLLINPYLLAGVVLILVLKKLDKPIDIVYIALLAFYLILYKTTYSFICIIPLVTQVIVSKKEKISFMVSIELAFTIIITLNLIVL